jgi:hypothetical protein
MDSKKDNHSVFGMSCFGMSPFKRLLRDDVRVERKCVMEIQAGGWNAMALNDEEWAALRDLIDKTDRAVAALHLETEKPSIKGCGTSIEIRPSLLLAVRVCQIFDELGYEILKGTANFSDDTACIVDLNQTEWNKLRTLTAE